FRYQAQRGKLTAEKRKEIAEAFKLFDKNGDGQISVEELGEAMKQAGQEVCEEDLQEMIKAVDRNGKSWILDSTYATDSGSQVKDYQRLDFGFQSLTKETNGDGYITGDELKTVMKTFGGKTYTTKEIDDMIKEADMDDDGKVSYEGVF
ncbi:unnamed protein product, partial [Porites evermanni]